MNGETLLMLCVDCIFPPSEDLIKARMFCGITPFPRLIEKNNCLSLFRLTDPLVASAIHSFKYEHNKKVRNIFADSLVWAIKRLIDVHGKEYGRPIISFLPPRPERFSDTGYDQGEFLMQRVIELEPTMDIRSHILIRKQGRMRQAHLNSHTDRHINARNVFYLNKNYSTNLYNKWIIIIDDVSTSGSTFEEARLTIGKANPLHITFLAIAT